MAQVVPFLGEPISEPVIADPVAVVICGSLGTLLWIPFGGHVPVVWLRIDFRSIETVRIRRYARSPR